MSNPSTFSNNNNPSPILYVDNILSYLIDDSNPSTKQEDYPANYYSYYHQLSPLFYYEIDNFDDFLIDHNLDIMQQSLLANNSSILTDDSSVLEVDHNKVADSNKGDEINGIVEDNSEMDRTIRLTKNGNIGGLKKRKRTSNKERHSKIRTAHGLRDRRMRINLQVARPFFKLQDMLGFDKASRTVEWLMTQSKPAIEELFQSKHGSPSGVTKCTTSSTSDDCEVESKTAEELNEHPKEKRGSTCAKIDELQHKRRRTTKEKRKVAREKAKKRTLERMQSRRVVNNEGGGNDFVVVRDDHALNDTDISGSWNPLSTLSFQQSFEGCQSVPNYTISTQRNMVGGP